MAEPLAVTLIPNETCRVAIKGIGVQQVVALANLGFICTEGSRKLSKLAGQPRRRMDRFDVISGTKTVIIDSRCCLGFCLPQSCRLVTCLGPRTLASGADPSIFSQPRNKPRIIPVKKYGAGANASR